MMREHIPNEVYGCMVVWLRVCVCVYVYVCTCMCVCVYACTCVFPRSFISVPPPLSDLTYIFIFDYIFGITTCTVYVYTLYSKYLYR